MFQYFLQRNGSEDGIDKLYIAPLSVVPDHGQVSANEPGVWIATDANSPITRKLDAAKATAAGSFLESLVAKNKEPDSERTAAVFLVSNKGGYVRDSNFMVYRTVSCPLISSASSFLAPLSKVLPWSGKLEDSNDVASALEASIGAIEFPLALISQGLEQLTFEIERRLALPWLQAEPIQPKRVLAVLQQSGAVDLKSEWETARSLGVKLVILSQGSWWADGCGVLEELRESFISIEMRAHDPELWKDIVDVIKSYPHPIDGIFAPTDPYLVSVAQAAEALGLWTPGPLPFSRSTNKHATRELLDPEGKTFFAITSLQDLDQRIASGSLIPFPVICKPAKSASSEGVYKVQNESELRDAVARVLKLDQSKHGILIEPYVDGPEVDVNLVLLDGRILYSEVVDEFPTPGDLAGDEDASTVRFQETQSLVPSHLPKAEQEAVTADMLGIVQLQGFRTGVYHCEARVCNSTMNYVLEPGATFPTLQSRKDLQSSGSLKPYAFLHEVNARGPAQLSSATTKASRGIDFWQLQMLAAIGDEARYAALATPFLHDEKCNNVILSATTSIVSQKLLTDMYPGQQISQYDNKTLAGPYDPMPELYRRHSITKYIVRHRSKAMHSKGLDGKAAEWIWVNGIVVCSPKDRKHALGIVEDFTKIYHDYVREMDEKAQV